MTFSFQCRLSLTLLLLSVVSSTSWGQAVSSVTSINTTDVVAASPQTRNGLTEFSGTNTYNVTYNGIERRLNSFVSNSQLWAPTRSDGVVHVLRNNASGANQSFPLINPNQTAGWNQFISSTGTGPLNHTVSGVYHNTMPSLFQSNNIFTGTENLFVNTDAGNAGNPNVVTNIERMDYVFPTATIAAPNRGFAVFERGLGSGGGGTNGTFRIAAITSIDGSGNATGFGSTVLRITPAQYNNGGVGVGIPVFNYDVTRFATAAGPDLDLMNNANIGPQGIAGALIPTSALVTAGTPVFGYAVFGDDVTGTGSQLLDVTNTTFFPQLSPFSNDMDMVATGAMIFVAVPEPTTWALIGLCTGVGAYGIYVRRRRAARTVEQEVVVPVE